MPVYLWFSRIRDKGLRIRLNGVLFSSGGDRAASYTYPQGDEYLQTPDH